MHGTTAHSSARCTNRNPQPHKYMKTKQILLVAAVAAFFIVLSPGSIQAAAVFYSFQTEPDGGTFTTAVTAISGFESASGVSMVGTNILATGAGGAASFTDFEGTTWTGSGGSVTPGRSMVWNTGSEGNSFSLTLNTTGLEDLNVRMEIRSTGTVSPSTFTSLTYQIGSGDPLNIDSVDLSFPNNSLIYHVWSADLSSISALSNQPAVTFTWSIPNITGSVRIDNLQFTAVPEPSPMPIIAASFAVLAAFAIRRRRSSRSV